MVWIELDEDGKQLMEVLTKEGITAVDTIKLGFSIDRMRPVEGGGQRFESGTDDTYKLELILPCGRRLTIDSDTSSNRTYDPLISVVLQMSAIPIVAKHIEVTANRTINHFTAYQLLRIKSDSFTVVNINDPEINNEDYNLRFYSFGAPEPQCKSLRIDLPIPLDVEHLVFIKEHLSKPEILETVEFWVNSDEEFEEFLDGELGIFIETSEEDYFECDDEDCECEDGRKCGETYEYKRNEAMANKELFTDPRNKFMNVYYFGPTLQFCFRREWSLDFPGWENRLIMTKLPLFTNIKEDLIPLVFNEKKSISWETHREKVGE